MKPAPSDSPARQRLIRRHLVEGWGALCLFLVLGAVLELLLAFKIDFYVRADQTTVRLMWRLAHGHGTLLGVVHLAFAFSLSCLSERHVPQPAGLLSGFLSAASLLIPGGFFLAGLDVDQGDPGAAVALVPMGAVLLIFTAGSLAWCLRRP